MGFEQGEEGGVVEWGGAVAVEGGLVWVGVVVVGGVVVVVVVWGGRRWEEDLLDFGEVGGAVEDEGEDVAFVRVDFWWDFVVEGVGCADYALLFVLRDQYWHFVGITMYKWVDLEIEGKGYIPPFSPSLAPRAANQFEHLHTNPGMLLSALSALA